jgi:hypothetical protein
MGERCDGIATASDREQAFRLRECGRSLRRGGRALIEGGRLEGADRAVPDQGLAGLQQLADLFCGFRPDVEDHLIRRHRADIDGLGRHAGLELAGGHGVDRQYDAAVLLLGFRDDLARGLGHVALRQ